MEETSVPTPEVPTTPVVEEVPAAPATEEITGTVTEEPSVPVAEDTTTSGQGYTLGLFEVCNDSGKTFSQIYLKTDRSADWNLWYAEPTYVGDSVYENNFNIPNEYIALRIVCDDGTEFTWECDTLRVGWNYDWDYDENGYPIGRTWSFYEGGSAEVGVQIYPTVDGTASIWWM